MVSGINLILPVAFRIIASLEKYRSPRTTINVNLLRYNFIYIVFAAWEVRIGKNCSTGLKYASGHAHFRPRAQSFSTAIWTVDLKEFYFTPPMTQNSTLLRNCWLSNMHIVYTSCNNYLHFYLTILIRTTVMMLVSVTMVTVMLFIDVQRCRSGGEPFSTDDRKCDKVRGLEL